MSSIETASRDPGGAQSVDRALTLLSLIGRHAERGASLAAIVSGSGLNRPTARRLVLALMRSRLVEQDPVSRRYFIGEEAYVLGVLASRRFGFLDVAMESLVALSAKSGDTSFASIRRGDFAVCLHREEGSYPIRTHALIAGNRHPLGVGGGALAMLAALDDVEVERVLAANAAILAADYPSYSAELLREHVALARRRGYSLNPGLVVPNSWAIGLAVRSPDGQVAGALSIAAIDARLGEARQQELAYYLSQEVARVEAGLKARFDGSTGAPVAPERRDQPPAHRTTAMGGIGA